VFTKAYGQQNKPFVVVLDAGHGGKDPGKVGYKGAKEKDVALNIVLKTGKVLSEIPGIKVMYTRNKDVFVDLWKRGNIANDADADLFVSVHCNAHTSQAIGAETWVLGLHANERNLRVAKAENEVILQEENHEERYHGFDASSPTSVIGLSLEQEEYLDQSLLLASLIQEEFEKKLRRVNRGVKQAGFVVLYQTYMPSVLIETGFLTNRIEGKYLYSKAGQDQMSKSIAKSILTYYDRQQVNVAKKEYSNELEKEEVSSIDQKSQDEVSYYKIQLASAKRKISTASYNFKGFRNVERVKIDTFYKYYLGKFYSRKDAENSLLLAKSKGYKTAFIAPFTAQGDLASLKNIDTKPFIDPVPVTISVEKEETPSLNVSYRVQIAASKKKIIANPSNFKGLKEVVVKIEGDYYKYYLLITEDYNKAKDGLKLAKKKGYKSSFLVAFLNDKRITLKEALKIEVN